ncbi:MAG: CapA family protein [Ruminiclostridium sp.]|nr:CapA family protein [Ruminiclostridium sp.]
MNVTKDRIYLFDNLKGILMLLVVFAHMLLPFQSDNAIDLTFDFIYMFHMPAFIFLSGYLGKSKKSSSFSSVIKLIFLYFIFNSIMGFIYGFGSLIVPLYSFWYLLALIVWRITAERIAKFKDIVLILVFIAMMAGFFPTIDNTLSISRIICFYPFYMAGYLYSEEKMQAVINMKLSARLSKGFLILAGGFIIGFFCRNYFGYTDGALMMDVYPTPMAAAGRLALLAIAAVFIISLLYLAPRKKLPLLSVMGKNSLWIYLLHRPITLLITDNLPLLEAPVLIAVATGCTIAICFISGNDFLADILNKFLTQGAEMFTSDKKGFSVAKLVSGLVAFGLCFVAVWGAIPKELPPDKEDTGTPAPVTDVIYNVMTTQQKEAFDNAFKITFSGDLILLEDQVKRAYDGEKYDFSDVFHYAKEYISSADLAIGVFEGPMAGEQVGYSSSNYDDGKTLALNFPDEFGIAVKDAGFDLVTTANNHVLDKGTDGALRTLDKLDEIGLDHTGSYRNADEKENKRVKLLECQGIKFAVLSYTYGSNGYSTDDFINGDVSHITSVISGVEGEQFEVLKEKVKKDFEKAKSLSPDLIIVLPHIGTQFSNSADSEQEAWYQIFRECGADIILGDHAHAVEPAFINDYNGKKVFEAYCPGNFANIYRENQGDTSMLVDVYIDKNTKQVIGGGIVPLYTQSSADGNYRALPVYEMMTNKELRRQLSTDELKKAEQSTEIITSVVFGSGMDINSVTETMYFNENGFLRSINDGLTLDDDMKNGLLYNAMTDAESICFIGDSVTEGTKNGGCPWYEPITPYFSDKKIYNHSKGGCTISYLIDTAEGIPACDLYVIAIGTNDVRYRDKDTCAMTSAEFTDRAEQLMQKLIEKNSKAEIIFIAPWHSTDGDSVSSLPYSTKLSLNNEYSNALKKFCDENDCGFINANPFIIEKLTYSPDRTYLLDHIHPNAGVGVVMYSQAVLTSD